MVPSSIIDKHFDRVVEHAFIGADLGIICERLLSGADPKRRHSRRILIEVERIISGGRKIDFARCFDATPPKGLQRRPLVFGHGDLN